MNHVKVLALATSQYRQQLESILDSNYIYCAQMMAPNIHILDQALAVAAEGVVILSNELSDGECEFIEKFHQVQPGMVMILITEQLNVDILTKSMQCGIAKVLETKAGRESICKDIMSEVDKARGMNMAVSDKSVTISSVTSANDVLNRRATIISSFGTKGGTGKTTIAVNTAVALQSQGKKVAIIDLDLQFGDVGVFMDVPKCDTIYDLVMEGDFSASVINSYMYTHSSGVKVLCAPDSPEYAEVIKPEYIRTIGEALRPEYDYIIFDMSPTIDECVLEALDITDVIYFVTNPEISTLKNSKICLNVLNTLGMANKVRFVLNKYGDSYVKVKDMEAALDKEMYWVVPSDSKSTVSAINRGVPVVLATPNSKASKAIMKYIETGEI